VSTGHTDTEERWLQANGYRSWLNYHDGDYHDGDRGFVTDYWHFLHDDALAEPVLELAVRYGATANLFDMEVIDRVHPRPYLSLRTTQAQPARQEVLEDEREAVPADAEGKPTPAVPPAEAPLQPGRHVRRPPAAQVVAPRQQHRTDPRLGQLHVPRAHLPLPARDHSGVRERVGRAARVVQQGLVVGHAAELAGAGQLPDGLLDQALEPDGDLLPRWEFAGKPVPQAFGLGPAAASGPDVTRPPHFHHGTGHVPAVAHQVDEACVRPDPQQAVEPPVDRGPDEGLGSPLLHEE